MDLEFGIDAFEYSGFLRRDQKSVETPKGKVTMSELLKDSLPCDELELLKQTECEIDECMGSGRYEEARHLQVLLDSRYSDINRGPVVDNHHPIKNDKIERQF